jgi:peptidase M28-like protein
VIDFRIYRAGFAPAVAAVVALLFALTAPPDPLPTAVAPAEFDGRAATRLAHEIVDMAPDRTPGSEGDARVGDLVAQRFGQVDSGEVSEQNFSGQFDGDDVDMRNVILTLPGDSPRTVVLMAPRDSAGGPGAASSAAATGMLLQLVNQLRTQSHDKTLVFVSTDGSSAGAAGASEFARNYSQRDEIDAVIDLWQPGYGYPRPPFVLESSAGSQSPPAQLARTAEHVLSDQTPHKQGSETTLGALADLAVPSGLGETAVLIQSGLESVGLSSAGERPLPASQDQVANLSSSTMTEFGRTALLLAAAIDASPEPLEHGPSTYVPMAGNLVPGWTLALLALTLLLPAALAAGDGVARATRTGRSPGWAVAWAGSRAVPLLAGLLFFYLLALVGLVARPTFPFDPNLYSVGPGQLIVMLLCAGVVGGAYYATRGWRVPGAISRQAAVPALGAVSTVAAFLVWLANPFLGLLLVPTAHVWLICARRRGSLPWPAVAAAAVVSLVPLIAAIGHVSGQLALGGSAPWLLLLMVSGGQIGFGTMLSLSLVLGGLLGVLALSLRRGAPPRPRRSAPGPSGPLDPEARLVPEPEPVGQSAEGLDTSPITSREEDDDLRSDG